MKIHHISIIAGLLATATCTTSCLPLFTEYNMCDKMDAWGKEVPYSKKTPPRAACFYELGGVYYVEMTAEYVEESLPIRIEYDKCSVSKWPTEKKRTLYTEQYYLALTPQQVADYLGRQAPPWPEGTVPVLPEGRFDKASARQHRLSAEAICRIDLKREHPRHLEWPIDTPGHPTDKRSVFNYMRMPITYTVGPLLNTMLWLGEGGVCTCALIISSPLELCKQPNTQPRKDGEAPQPQQP